MISIDKFFLMFDNRYMDLLKRIFMFFLDAFQAILVVASFFLILYIFVVQPHEVSGSSMFPTFKDKEWLLSSLLDVKLDTLKRGDVIVFHAPDASEKLYIKRIIGIEGDTVMVQGGSVYLNGTLLNESAYLKDVSTYGGGFIQEGTPQVVPPGELIVMGDNRPNSSDSRQWGFLKKDRIIGKSVVRVLPVNTFTIISNPYK
jgi:signal peptidase I